MFYFASVGNVSIKWWAGPNNCLFEWVSVAISPGYYFFQTEVILSTETKLRNQYTGKWIKTNSVVKTFQFDDNSWGQYSSWKGKVYFARTRIFVRFPMSLMKARRDCRRPSCPLFFCSIVYFRTNTELLQIIVLWKVIWLEFACLEASDFFCSVMAKRRYTWFGLPCSGWNFFIED